MRHGRVCAAGPEYRGFFTKWRRKTAGKKTRVNQGLWKKSLLVVGPSPALNPKYPGVGRAEGPALPLDPAEVLPDQGERDDARLQEEGEGGADGCGGVGGAGVHPQEWRTLVEQLWAQAGLITDHLLLDNTRHTRHHQPTVIIIMVLCNITVILTAVSLWSPPQ